MPERCCTAATSSRLCAGFSTRAGTRTRRPGSGPGSAAGRWPGTRRVTAEPHHRPERQHDQDPDRDSQASAVPNSQGRRRKLTRRILPCPGIWGRLSVPGLSGGQYVASMWRMAHDASYAGDEQSVLLLAPLEDAGPAVAGRGGHRRGDPGRDRGHPGRHVLGRGAAGYPRGSPARPDAVADGAAAALADHHLRADEPAAAGAFGILTAAARASRWPGSTMSRSRRACWTGLLGTGALVVESAGEHGRSRWPRSRTLRPCTPRCSGWSRRSSGGWNSSSAHSRRLESRKRRYPAGHDGITLTPYPVAGTTASVIAEIILDRPPANALSTAMARALTVACAWTRCRAERAGPPWCSARTRIGRALLQPGADLKERAAMTDAEFTAQRTVIRGVFDAIRDLPQAACRGCTCLPSAAASSWRLCLRPESSPTRPRRSGCPK